MALVAAPGVLIVYVTLGLVRMVNRSSGLRARRSDSVVLTVVAIWLMYAMASPLYGLVAALAFMLDGSLREPLADGFKAHHLCLELAETDSQRVHVITGLRLGRLERVALGVDNLCE